MLLIDKVLILTYALFLGSSLIAVNIMHSLFSQISANRDGSFPFNESEAVFIAELAKASLAFALLLVAFLKKQKTNTEANFQNVHYFNHPFGFFRNDYSCSTIHSKQHFVIYRDWVVRVTGYQLFSNAKIIITALTFRIIIQTPFTIIQWTSLCLLFSALLLAKNSKYEFSLNEKDTDRLVIGISMVLVLSFASSFYWVYSEIKLKGQINIQCYKMVYFIFGVVYFHYYNLMLNISCNFLTKIRISDIKQSALLSFENFLFLYGGPL